jgi:hypothetical protein
VARTFVFFSRKIDGPDPFSNGVLDASAQAFVPQGKQKGRPRGDRQQTFSPLVKRPTAPGSTLGMVRVVSNPFSCARAREESLKTHPSRPRRGTLRISILRCPRRLVESGSCAPALQGRPRRERLQKRVLGSQVVHREFTSGVLMKPAGSLIVRVRISGIGLRRLLVRFPWAE